MANKNFATAPKPKSPTAEQIEQFERGGVGHDKSSNSRSEARNSKNEPTTRLSLDLPENLHKRFKSACGAT